MSSEVLLDTDVLVDHLRGARMVPDTLEDPWYSTITRAELYAGSRTDEATVEALLSRMRERVVDRRTAELGGRIRRVFGLSLADALIAATALLNDLDLVSRKRRHFERVPGLQLRESP